MDKKTGTVTLHGNTLTLAGNAIKVGDKAPDFEVLSNDMSPVKLSAFKGRLIVISSVPSLDTPVCDTETVRFNREAEKFGSDIVMLTISMDLPFAQSRWCAAKAVKNLQTLSDHREASFGTAYGVLIKELRLLARTIFIIDSEGIVRYIQLVKEVSKEPDYDDVLQSLTSLLHGGKT